jgi:small conductance mechanosensitive channel
MPDSVLQLGSTFAAWRGVLVDVAVRYGLQALGALVILFVGLRLSRWAGGLLDAWLQRRALDVSLRELTVRVFRVLIVVATVAVAAEKAGVPVTSLIAGIGVAGVGAGFALQGVLGNVFAGLSILFTRPYRVGEYIEILTVHGQVTEISLFSTTLLHADRSRVVIPNRKIVGEILHNYGTTRQLDLTVAVAYDSDLERVLALARATVEADARVLRDPSPIIGIAALGESAISVRVRPWVAVPDHPTTGADLYRALVQAFRAGGVEMPFPQREVRLIGRPAAA